MLCYLNYVAMFKSEVWAYKLLQHSTDANIYNHDDIYGLGPN